MKKKRLIPNEIKAKLRELRKQVNTNAMVWYEYLDARSQLLAPTHRMRRGKRVEIPEAWRGRTVWPMQLRRRRSDRWAKKKKPLSGWGLGHKGGKDGPPPGKLVRAHFFRGLSLDDGEE